MHPNDIYTVDSDIFCPCALGAILNDTTIPLLKSKIVAGGANNQLAHDMHGNKLYEKGIFYAPDYVVNAGGIIWCAYGASDFGQADLKFRYKSQF